MSPEQSLSSMYTFRTSRYIFMRSYRNTTPFLKACKWQITRAFSASYFGSLPIGQPFFKRAIAFSSLSVYSALNSLSLCSLVPPTGDICQTARLGAMGSTLSVSLFVKYNSRRVVYRVFSDKGSGPVFRTYSKNIINALGCCAKRWMKSAGLADGASPTSSSEVGVQRRIKSAVVSSGRLVTSILPYFLRASTALCDLRLDK
mmetsp:Transcript_6040/g.11077  ORF Transcript_6040/g.11077 Transcript_6040/m.11077 type:complete len:202 (-) Transcript_6040:1434-2039(-)